MNGTSTDVNIQFLEQRNRFGKTLDWFCYPNNDEIEAMIKTVNGICRRCKPLLNYLVDALVTTRNNNCTIISLPYTFFFMASFTFPMVLAMASAIPFTSKLDGSHRPTNSSWILPWVAILVAVDDKNSDKRPALRIYFRLSVTRKPCSPIFTSSSVLL